jgi:hypothetical protein
LSKPYCGGGSPTNFGLEHIFISYLVSGVGIEKIPALIAWDLLFVNEFI